MPLSKLGGARTLLHTVLKSITARTTLLFASASTAVMLSLGFLIGGSVEKHFEEEDMELLVGKLELARHVLEKARSPQDLAALPQQLADSLIGHHGLALLVLAPGGRPLFATPGAEFPPELLRPEDAPLRPRVWTTREAEPLRGISAAVRTGIAEAPPAVVAVATDISHHRHYMASFRSTLWSMVVAAALVTGLLGWGAVRRGLAPLRAIRQSAAGITANRLDRRLSLEAVPPELAELAQALNEMLTRLEESFRRLSDFSSDLAHELRTPVSNLLTQTQVMLAKARSANEYREVLASNAEEFERLSRMIADMLFLAKADNSLIVPNRESVDLAEEVRSLFEFYEAYAEDKGIGLNCSGRGIVLGDRLMLRRAINNLLSNAVRHTPGGGQVTVRIEATDTGAVKLSVENTGETIPAEHLPRLFDRFYRADASRQRFSEGAGLGLAITRSILRAHGGSAEAFSRDGSTRFELIIPA